MNNHRKNLRGIIKDIAHGSYFFIKQGQPLPQNSEEAAHPHEQKNKRDSKEISRSVKGQLVKI